MKRTLVQLYRNSNLYTLYYDETDGEIYKIPFGKKGSFTTTYLIVVALIITGTLFSSFYENYHNVALDIILIVVGIAVAYFVVNKLYKSYYLEEEIRPIFLDDSFFKSCASEGLKQSRREIVVLVISFLLAIASFMAFLLANRPKLLIVGSLSTACYLAFYYMKPLKRRRIIRKLRDGNLTNHY